MLSLRRIIIAFVIFFLLGVFFAPDFYADIKYLLVSVFIFFSFLLILRKTKYFIIPTFVLAATLGLLFFSANREKEIPVYEQNKEYEFSGFISSYPNSKEKNTTFIFQENSGVNFYVSASKLEDFDYGQKIKIYGKVVKIKNEDEFNFKDYFSSKNIYYQVFYPKIEKNGDFSGNYILGKLYFLRKVFVQKTEEVFVKPYSSFVLGILIGVKSMSNNFMDIFSRVSLSHIIVVSGYNLSIIVGAFSGIFSPISRRLSFWVPLFGIFFFTMIVGAEAPVMRAAIMASVILFSNKKGKKADSIVVLLIAALVMVLLNPYILRFDPGFQLSFLSTLGILLFADRIDCFILRLRVPKVFSEIISATLSAQVLILPVIAYYFGRISVIGPIANFVVLPFVPLVMLLSFIAILLSFINIEFAILFSKIPVLFLFLIIKASEWFAEINFSSISLTFNVLSVGIYFFLIFIFYIFLRKKNYAKKNA